MRSTKLYPFSARYERADNIYV